MGRKSLSTIFETERDNLSTTLGTNGFLVIEWHFGATEGVETSLDQGQL